MHGQHVGRNNNESKNDCEKKVSSTRCSASSSSSRIIEIDDDTSDENDLSSSCASSSIYNNTNTILQCATSKNGKNHKKGKVEEDAHNDDDEGTVSFLMECSSSCGSTEKHKNLCCQVWCSGGDEENGDGGSRNRRRRVFLLPLALLMGFLVPAICTIIFARKMDIAEFTNTYEKLTQEIITTSEHNIHSIIQSYELLSHQITASISSSYSFGGEVERSWPLVLFPEWEAMVAPLMKETNANYISFCPIVQDTQRQEYEELWIETTTTITAAAAVPNQNRNNNNSTPVPAGEMMSEPRFIVEAYYEEDDDDEEVDEAIKSSMILYPAVDAERYVPITQIAPLKDYYPFLNYNVLNISFFPQVLDHILYEMNEPIVSEIIYYEQYDDDDEKSKKTKKEKEDGGEVQEVDPTTRIMDYGSHLGGEDRHQFPSSLLTIPIHDHLGGKVTGGEEKEQDHYRQNPIVAVLVVELPIQTYFSNLIPGNDMNGIFLVVKNTCHQQLTYQLFKNGSGNDDDDNNNNNEIIFLGKGDRHDPSYNHLEIAVELTILSSIPDCTYSIHIYPSNDYASSYRTSRSIGYTIAILLTFFEIGLVFLIYGWRMGRRQHQVLEPTTTTRGQQSTLGSSPVPETIDTPPDDDTERGLTKRISSPSDIDKLNDDPWKCLQSKLPQPDSYPHATILMGKFIGFIPWSSATSPKQVFLLLETLHNAFHSIALQLGVIPVEAMGESYIAVTGLNTLEKHHDDVVVMAEFARQCMNEFHHILQTLSHQLGPGTTDLALRFGIHSGTVTAGLTHGNQSGLQLLGDTVHTARRIEKAGSRNKIQLSQTSAELLVAAGKTKWIHQRERRHRGKRKVLQTYWLICLPRRPPPPTNTNHINDGSNYSREYQQVSSYRHVDFTGRIEDVEAKPRSSSTILSKRTVEVDRLISWNAKVLETFLIRIVAMRGGLLSVGQSNLIAELTHTKSVKQDSVLDEFRDAIKLPTKVTMYEQDPNSIKLPPEVTEQLHDYVQAIAYMYNDHEFHSFAHACHVLQSIIKLLAKVSKHDLPYYDDDDDTNEPSDSIYSIAFDPLTQFACAFSALIHDVDHSGVPNAQLVKEESDIAVFYKDKSVAEQNSVDLAWELLMETKYGELRSCIFTTQEELDRFRQIVVNCVIATDLMDKDLNTTRRKRWNMTLGNSRVPSSQNMKRQEKLNNRKATLVIEHLIQACDVAHTMQHWDIYRKWNERLFREAYYAYECRRGEADPTIYWYDTELEFFDNYIIPLAEKINGCGVFGVAGEEYLTFCISNRRDWKVKGKAAVRQYLSNYREDNNDRGSLCSVASSQDDSVISS